MNIWENGRPTMPDGTPQTWTERVRIEQPDAPDWLMVWAKAMDGLDEIEAGIRRLLPVQEETRP
jgi:hypothetical protein